MEKIDRALIIDLGRGLILYFENSLVVLNIKEGKKWSESEIEYSKSRENNQKQLLKLNAFDSH